MKKILALHTSCILLLSIVLGIYATQIFSQVAEYKLNKEKIQEIWTSEGLPEYMLGRTIETLSIDLMFTITAIMLVATVGYFGNTLVRKIETKGEMAKTILLIIDGMCLMCSTDWRQSLNILLIGEQALLWGVILNGIFIFATRNMINSRLRTIYCMYFLSATSTLLFMVFYPGQNPDEGYAFPLGVPRDIITPRARNNIIKLCKKFNFPLKNVHYVGRKIVAVTQVTFGVSEVILGKDLIDGLNGLNEDGKLDNEKTRDMNLIAVFCHELGHALTPDLLYRSIFFFVSTATILILLGVVAHYLFKSPSNHSALYIYFCMLCLYVSLSFIMKWTCNPLWFQQHEFDADRFAVENGYGKYICSSMIKLIKGAPEHTFSHNRFYGMNHVHPASYRRIEAVRNYSN